MPLGLAGFVPEVAGSSLALFGDLALVSVDFSGFTNAGGSGSLGRVLFVNMAADLDARVQVWIAFYLQLQFKIRILLLGR